MVDHELSESPRAHALVEQVMDQEVSDFDFRKHDIQAHMISLVPMLVVKARIAAANYSDSWRGFGVGGSALAYDIDPLSPRVGIYTSGNFRARHGEDYSPEHDAPDMPKICAEMDIMMRAGHDDMQRIGLFVVAATTRHQRILEVTKVRSATLHPCKDCEDIMRGNPLVDNDTIILTVGTGENIYQAQSYREFSDRYKHKQQGEAFKDADTHTYRSTDWLDRGAYYRQEAKRQRLPKSVYTPDVHRELARRRLALQAIRAPLEVNSLVS